LIKVFFAQFPRNGADIGEILLIVAFLSPLRQLVWKLSAKFNDFIVKKKIRYILLTSFHTAVLKRQKFQQKLVLHIIVLH